MVYSNHRAAAVAAFVMLAAVAAPPTARAEPSASYAFAFQDADLAQVAEEVLGVALRSSYVVEPGVTARLTFRIDRRLTRAQLLTAFEATLAAHDLALVRDGDRYLVTTRSKARAFAEPRFGPPRSPGYELLAVPLAHASPNEVAKVLQAMGAESLVVHVDEKSGLLLLGGGARQLESALHAVRIFDRSSLSGARIGWFELKKAPASTVAQDLERVLQASGTAGVVVVPLRRLNGVFVFARTADTLAEVKPWIERLDVESREEASALWIYRPRSLSAESLGQTLNSVMSGQARLGAVNAAAEGGVSTPPATASAQTATFVASAEDAVRVGVDKESNVLLISAPASRWVQIQKILEEIDRIPGQVLIEATILEVTLGDEFRLGVDWSVLATSGRLRVSSVGDRQGVVGAQFPGFSVTFLDDDVRAAVNALGSRTDVEVVSAPKIVALDNRTARLQVGDQVPVVTQSARSTNAPDAPVVVSTEYRNTGVILEVTPRLSADGRILLQVIQEVSSVAKTTTSGIDSPTIQQRRMESTLVLTDGGVVALGGLMSDSRSTGRSGVPGLQDAPGLGALFGSRSRDRRRTELIVLLTARRVPDQGGAAVATLLEDLQEIDRRGLLER